MNIISKETYISIKEYTNANEYTGSPYIGIKMAIIGTYVAIDNAVITVSTNRSVHMF
jgi:hypothetical protein